MRYIKHLHTTYAQVITFVFMNDPKLHNAHKVVIRTDIMVNNVFGTITSSLLSNISGFKYKDFLVFDIVYAVMRLGLLSCNKLVYSIDQWKKRLKVMDD